MTGSIGGNVLQQIQQQVNAVNGGYMTSEPPRIYTVGETVLFDSCREGEVIGRAFAKGDVPSAYQVKEPLWFGFRELWILAYRVSGAIAK